MLNIVVPMAGAGSRFARAGYPDPKPLIRVHGVPMIKVVIDNIRPSTPHRFIFICQHAHVIAYDLAKQLRAWAPGCVIIELNGLTDGAACTVLEATSWINNDDALMIANSDQYIDINIDDYLNQMDIQKVDGLIMTMKAHDPKWSFASLDASGKVALVVEKEVISEEATVGIYNFRRGRDFVRAAEKLQAEGVRVNGEFYVAPTYNPLIQEGLAVGVHNIGSDGHGMYGLGTPADLERFLDRGGA